MQITATFQDPSGRFAGQADLLVKNAIAGFNVWTPYLAESSAAIDIKFHLVGGYSNRGGGRSTTSVEVGSAAGVTIIDQGAAFEIRTGNDPNGVEADVEIFFDVDFFAAHYWINPLNGDIAPADRTDLVSLIAHELGHALGFNGFAADAALSASYASRFDQLIVYQNGLPYFSGANAVALNGGLVPLTPGNLFHVSHGADDHADDLMNGVSFAHGSSYAVSALDVAMLSDLGLPTVLSDRLFGSSLSDTIAGGDGDDSLAGLAADDHLAGNQGADSLDGGLGADTLVGGKGADLLVGGAGADLLSGDRGDDTLTGGTGADTFSFSTPVGRDVVTDFNILEGDRVVIAQGASPYTIALQGDDTVISFGDGDAVTLTGVHLPQSGQGWLFAA